MLNRFRLKSSASNSSSFLPEDYIARRGELRSSVISLGLFAVVMTLVIGAFLVTNTRWESVRARQESVNVLYTQEAERIEQLKKLEEQKSQMLGKAEVVTALVEKVPRSVLFSELVTRMPASMTLLEFNLDGKRVEPPKEDAKGAKLKTLSGQDAKKAKAPAKGAPAKAQGKGADAGAAKDQPPPPPPRPAPPKYEYTLTLVGVSANNSDVADYIAKLKTCTLLESVDVQYIKETIINDQGLRKFEISALIRKDADGRSLAGRTAQSPSPARPSAQATAEMPEGR